MPITGAPSQPADIIVDRSEVSQAAHWNDASGSDFFMNPSAAQVTTTGNRDSLVDVGWLSATLATQFVAGTGADFLATVDKGVPAHYVTNAASDVLQSPSIFGDYVHGNQASHHLGGVAPTTLTAEFWAAFSVASNSETGTEIGFVQSGGNAAVAANALAMIHSDGTNFICRASADADTGAVIDTAWHLWKIVLSQGTTNAVEWFIDGTSQGTLDLMEDVFPVAWGAGVVAAGANRILIGPARVYYRP